MKNELLKIGPFTVYGYGLMIAVGILAAYFTGERRAKKRGLPYEHVFNLVVWCVLGGFLGAKILYWITEWKSIVANPGFLGDTLTDGFVVFGGIIGGILTAYVYTGAMVLGKTKTLISGKSIIRTVPKGQRYITEGTHEAIVSREEFEKAQLVIKSNSHKVLMGSVDFPLKGKVRCGNCRRVMAHNFKQTVPTFWCREGLELVGQTQCTSEVFQVSDIENAVFQALKKELSLLDSLYGDIQKEEQDLKEAHKKANRRKTLMEQELKNLKGEKMRMYEEYAAGTLPLDTYKQKKQECDRRISEVQEQIEQSQAEESGESVVPGTVRAAAEQAENFLHGTRLTAGMVSAFIENVFVHDGGRIVVRFKYERSIQDTVKALHTS